jgi:hypothetical protein
MALMLGYYSPVELAVAPGCSRLVQASSVFVQGIEVSSGRTLRRLAHALTLRGTTLNFLAL